MKQPPFDLVSATIELAQSKGLTYVEARRELGRRGRASRDSRNALRRAHTVLLERKKIA
jgi:hypothetical protein